VEVIDHGERCVFGPDEVGQGRFTVLVPLIAASREEES